MLDWIRCKTTTTLLQKNRNLENENPIGKLKIYFYGNFRFVPNKIYLYQNNVIKACDNKTMIAHVSTNNEPHDVI